MTFKDGATTLGTITLSGGVAKYTTTALIVGTHSITAAYSGGNNFNVSTSAVLTQTVKSATKTNTTTTLVSSLNPSIYQKSVTFTATVKSVTTGTPQGTVTFKDGTTTLGTGTLNASGVGKFTITTLLVGTHSITAAYGGSTTFNASTSAVLTETVNKDNTTTKLVSSLNPSNKGQSVTFTATVTSTNGGVPQNTVTFKDGTTTLGTGTLTTGVAKFTTSALAQGSHSITAVYSGGNNFNVSTSAVLTQKVN